MGSAVADRRYRCCVFNRAGRFGVMSKTMRAVEVPRAGEPLELVERDVPEPERGWVRVKVEACGICHSESLVKEGLWPGMQYPRVPGHEIIGVVDRVGDGVKPWKNGQRVGIGWHGGNCGYCDNCRRGDFFACSVALLTTGISFDGGYAEYMVAPAKDKGAFAKELGAHHYIDSQASDPAAELNKLGGAKVVIATVTHAGAMAAVLGGLAPNGVLMVIGAAGPLSVDPILLISGCRSVEGWYSGTAIDSQDTLSFSASSGVHSMNEVFPLERAAEAYERMMSGKARFRVVLDIGAKS